MFCAVTSELHSSCVTGARRLVLVCACTGTVPRGLFFVSALLVG
jgi:hypothetical protein